MSARSVRCWPCTKRKASSNCDGTSKVTVTASRVSRATAAMINGWNLLIGKSIDLDGRFGSMRFEIIERLETIVAAVLRLARRRAVARLLAGARRVAAWARHVR